MGFQDGGLRTWSIDRRDAHSQRNFVLVRFIAYSVLFCPDSSNSNALQHFSMILDLAKRSSARTREDSSQRAAVLIVI
jgi:hypothetical protein